MRFIRDFTNIEIVDFLIKVDKEKSLGIMEHDELLEYKYSEPKIKNGKKHNIIKMSDYNGKNGIEIKIFCTDYNFSIVCQKDDGVAVEHDLSNEWRLFVREEMEQREKVAVKEITYIGRIIRNLAGKTLPKEYDKSCKKQDKEASLKQQESSL